MIGTDCLVSTKPIAMLPLFRIAVFLSFSLSVLCIQSAVTYRVAILLLGFHPKESNPSHISTAREM